MKREIKKISRNLEKPVQKYRFIIQSLFALLCIWIGVEFYLFIQYLSCNGSAAFYNRPPGVEGFLPISSLMSLYYFILTGEIHPFHPAGLFILIAIIMISFVFGKSFCSWFCPIGYISELIGDFGEKLLKRKFKIPKVLDYSLRSIKYLFLFFFIYVIFFQMSKYALIAFLDSPYNLTADIKMYYFFADISRFSLMIISFLFVLSILIRNFWCRYLCPYGALLGIISLLSPNKIKRDPKNCIDCGKCSKICPSVIKVDKVITILSDECTTCLNCIDVCPVKDTLNLKFLPTGKKLAKKIVAFGVVIIFLIVTGFGILTGNWQNNITPKEYLFYHKKLESYGHPTSMESVQKLNRKAGEIYSNKNQIVK